MTTGSVRKVVLVDTINGTAVGPFNSTDEAKVYIVDNEWGEDGWMIVDLLPLDAHYLEDDKESFDVCSFDRLQDFVVWQVQMGYLAANTVRDSGEVGRGLETNPEYVREFVSAYIEGVQDAE